MTGESAPVIRESGGDRSAVTGGTKVLSDRIVVEVTQLPGESFLDRMIALVEGASRRKTPNEIALGILLSGLTLIFLVVVVALRPFSEFADTERLDRDADRAARGAHPDNDRCAAVRHRDRRHGPAGAPQRAGAVGALGGSVRRRRRAAARQDRHDHARQSRGHRVRADARRRGGRARGGGPDRLAGGRDARGPLDRGAGQAVRPPRAPLRPIRPLRPVHGRDAHERRGFRRLPAAQGSRRRDHRLRRRRGRAGAAGAQAGGRPDSRRGRHAARGGARRPGARCGLPEGRGQGRHAAPLRPAARHGHPHRDGDRRQPAHGGKDRRRVGSRRLPRRGHPGAQARADPRANSARGGWSR